MINPRDSFDCSNVVCSKKRSASELDSNTTRVVLSNIRTEETQNTGKQEKRIRAASVLNTPIRLTLPVRVSESFLRQMPVTRPVPIAPPSSSQNIRLTLPVRVSESFLRQMPVTRPVPIALPSSSPNIRLTLPVGVPESFLKQMPVTRPVPVALPSSSQNIRPTLPVRVSESFLRQMPVTRPVPVALPSTQHIDKQKRVTFNSTPSVFTVPNREDLEEWSNELWISEEEHSITRAAASREQYCLAQLGLS